MKNVNEVSKISGVSIRTLHYYDEIGLLKPTKRTESNYRLYDDDAIIKLKTILMYKELEFPLEKIKELLSSTDKTEIIRAQISLLEQRKKHFEDLIITAKNMLSGVDFTDFSKFDEKTLKEYESEAKEKWGNTKEYAEYTAKKSDNDYSAELMEKFAKLGRLMDNPPQNDDVKNAVFEIKNFISENYYECSDEIFSGLADMYVLDERFKQNIDSVGGTGCAEFARKAIKYYFG